MNLLAQFSSPRGHSVNTPAQFSGLEQIFGNVLVVAVGFAGIILFLMIMRGGFGYITSGGDAKKTGEARNTLTYAIYGLVLVAMAYLILRVIASLTGVNALLNFQITQ